ncbi:outer membrane lipoprotein carrier protein [Nitratiruptor sp. YY08-26]|uniref:LolA-like outer membrane lipoprotein chaperone n=1 Tax=unclassified Nitratiruptor TaxID=2624044 RepID=UPI001914E913|nr:MULTISPECIES: LolA-like outer membrane lipoprotein chaperone [unclassified Nitratiruptor]BCD62181.1 outer membrane lipoprotein carrier protein [Nitratiruptor sp. YY08-13]BCD66117.1 outer membrane lipoprotein carrier protein [Nitratiruptor sp. YY08-26]
MKKLLLIFIVVIAYSFAKININTFHSKFLQTITNEQNKTLRYEGEVWFKKPLLVKWIYKKPLYKEIHIIANKVVVIEPELEQVTINHLQKDLNLLKILENAKKIENDHYKAAIEKKNFDIYFHNGKLKKISYQDDLGNLNEILFLDPEQNIELETKQFGYKINPEWDVIQE